MENKQFAGYDLTVIDENVRKMITHSLLGDTTAIDQLLRQDPELANCSWGYFSPLHFAVRAGHADTVKLLLEYGADATEILGWQDSPLTKARDRGFADIANVLEQHLARNYKSSPAGSNIASLIKEGNELDVLRELDSDPELIHSSDERGNTPMHWAVLTRQLWLIDELLRRGAKIDARRVDGSTPVHLAIHGDYYFRRYLRRQALRNEWFLAGYLVARGAEYDIWTASAVGDTDYVASLLQDNPSLANMQNSVDRRPLSYAAKYGYAETVKLLLDSGADPNAEDRDGSRGSALWNAVAGGHEECARLLLESGADTNAEVEAGGTPLFIATRNNHHTLARLLYTYGASMNLDAACCLGRIDLVGEIIHADRSLVNDGGDFGPLCLAAGYGHTDIVNMLIRAGADLNAPWYANNFIGYALDSGLDMVRLMLSSGAIPNNPNWLGVTYLHRAAWLGNIEFAKLLMEYGADLNAVDEEYNSTPLGWAAKYGKADMVRFLLESGADPSIPEYEPWAQPISWAERRGYTHVMDIIRGGKRDAL